MQANNRQAQPYQAVANLQTSQQSEPQPTPDELRESVKAVNDFVSTMSDSLQFRIDEDTGKTIVKVVDLSSHEVIKQIPSEEMVAIAKALDQLKGLLVQQKA